MTEQLLNWIEAEFLQRQGVGLEYRDGGAMCRKGPDAWFVVDGPVTEHMSDFDFRRATRDTSRTTTEGDENV